MIQSHSVNCSPIKPQAVSFGQGTSKTVENLERTADWIDTIGDNGLTEDSYAGLKDFSEQMPDGVFKTTATIFAAAGLSALALKKGAGKVLSAIRNNPKLNNEILNPVTKKVQQGLIKLEQKAAEKAAAIGKEKSIKAYLTSNAKKALEWVKTYSGRGIESKIEATQARIASIEESVQKAIINEAAKKGKKLTGKNLAAAVQTKLSGKSKIAEEYKNLKTSLDLMPTNNLIDKTVGNTLGAGAAVGATLETAKDKDKNGIPDIAEKKNKTEQEYED